MSNRKIDKTEFEALVAGRHDNPFAVLGPHSCPTGRVVRTLQPEARSVTLVDGDGDELSRMKEVQGASFSPSSSSWALRFRLTR